MFNGMMDPEMMKMAQEQMSRMSPADFARIQQQMMSNPELMRMASESMQSLRSEDLKFAADRLKHTRPEEMAEIGERMARTSPDELASMRARLDAQVSYDINAAEMLKKQGNELHSQGKYQAALEKYTRAKNNLKGIPTSKSRNILLACSLNMMSCYLHTEQYNNCIREGTEVLANDAKNVKGLYRRGQALKELGQLGDAVSDLRKALEVSPGDDTIAEVLRAAEERLTKERNKHPSRGLVIEEITEEASVSSEKHDNPALTQQHAADQSSTSQTEKPLNIRSNTEYLDALKHDPESIRSFQNFISQTDPETLPAINSGKVEGLSPDMVNTAANVIGKMPPEELQRMFQLASSFQEDHAYSKTGPPYSFGSVPLDLSPDMLNTATNLMTKLSPEELQKMFDMTSSMKGSEGSPSSSSPFHSYPGLVPSNMTPEMIKMATNIMSNMSPEEHKKMFEIASSLRGQDRPSTADLSTTRENHHVNGSESSSSQRVHSGSTHQASFLSPSAGLQVQMKDPAMRQMLTSMMKNMSPEMMANMSGQFGFKLSREDAERAQQAMSSLSPDLLETMMKWADRFQRGVEGARKTKNWLLGRPGMILAVLMLLLAVILHWFGFIGK